MGINDFKSFKYVVGNDFVYEDKIVVKVFFIYKYKNAVRSIDVKKKTGENDSYYIAEAKKVIDQEISNGKLAKFAKKYSSPASKKLKLTLAVVLSAAIIGPGSFYTWQYFDTIYQQEYAISHTVGLIRSLNPNSTEAEINEAIKSYEELPENLKNIVPEDVVEHLAKQKSLFELDKAEAKKIDDLASELSISSSTEIQLQRVETRFNQLTPRARTLLREGTAQLIQDVKNAIKADKEKAEMVSNSIMALPIDATWEQVSDVYVGIITLSTRAYSYITVEAKERITDIINVIEFETEVVDTMMQYANAYSSDDPHPTCTLDNINTLNYVYTDLLYERTQQALDLQGFSDLIEKAIEMYNEDFDIAKNIVTAAASLNPETCLDKDINAVKAKYEELATNSRIRTLADENGYSEYLNKAEAALEADKDATQKFYDETVGPILNPNCSQADINSVKAKYEEYCKTATPRLKTLISDPEYGFDLGGKIFEAQEKYNADLALAKELYDSCAPMLTSDCTLETINEVKTKFNDFINNPELTDRAKSFAQTGGPYDLQTKIKEAEDLYNRDVKLAADFDKVIADLPGGYFWLPVEQKQLLASCVVYISKPVDARHDYLPIRARGLIKQTTLDKINDLLTQRPDLPLDLTYEPTFNAVDGDEKCFESDNIIHFDPAVGLYVEGKLTKTQGRSWTYNSNPMCTKIMGQTDFRKVFDLSHNHVSCRVYVPSDASSSLRVEGVRYGPSIGLEPEHFITPTVQRGAFTTIDFEIMDFWSDTYNGYSTGIRGAKDSDIGKVFKITAHYSERHV